MAPLATKLYAPRRRRDLVRRPRLNSRRVTTHPPALTLVSAPAGFGKTTLLAEWLATSGRGARVAWVSLDGRDNDARLFWAYVVAGVGGRHRGCRARRSCAAAGRSVVDRRRPGDAPERPRRLRRPRWSWCCRRLPPHRRSPTCTSPSGSCSSTSHRTSTWCWRAGPTRRGRWRACVLGVSSSRLRGADLRFTTDEAVPTSTG